MSLLKFDEVAFRKVQYRNKYTKRSMIFFSFLLLVLVLVAMSNDFLKMGVAR